MFTAERDSFKDNFKRALEKTTATPKKEKKVFFMPQPVATITQ